MHPGTARFHLRTPASVRETARAEGGQKCTEVRVSLLGGVAAERLRSVCACVARLPARLVGAARRRQRCRRLRWLSDSTVTRPVLRFSRVRQTATLCTATEQGWSMGPGPGHQGHHCSITRKLERLRRPRAGRIVGGSVWNAGKGVKLDNQRAGPLPPPRPAAAGVSRTTT